MSVSDNELPHPNPPPEGEGTRESPPAEGAGNGVPAIQTVDMSKLFAGVRAVDELSLSIPKEGMTSIIGPNGSGKSTLVNLLSGVLPLDGGMVIIDGVGLRVVKAYENPEHSLTRTFQEVRLFEQITVWDNIMVVLTARGMLTAMLERVPAGAPAEGAGNPGDRGAVGQAARDGDEPFIRPTQAAGNRAGHGAERADVPVR